MSNSLRTAATGESDNPVVKLAGILTPRRGNIENVLPKHIDVDRFMQLAIYAYQSNDKLHECNAISVYDSIILSARLGLELTAGQAYLVPYKKKCTLVPGWKGLMDLVARAGRATAWTEAVYDGDFFEYQLGARPDVVHKKGGKRDPNKLLYTYAVGWVKGAEWPIVEVWDNETLLDHRRQHNKVGDNHYSFNNWEMYARKIPLLQAIKYLPHSIELADAQFVEDLNEAGKRPIIDGKTIRVADDTEHQRDPEPPATQRNTTDHQEKNAGSGSTQQPAGKEPTINDAITQFKAGNDADARDIARTLGAKALEMIEGMITVRDRNNPNAVKKDDKATGMGIE